MVDSLVGDSQFGGGGEGFADARVANEGGMGAAGDLEAYALAWLEVVGSGPDVDLEMQAAVFLGSYAVGSEADDSIAQVNGFTGWFHDTEPSEEVGMLQAGANVEIGCDGTDD